MFFPVILQGQHRFRMQQSGDLPAEIRQVQDSGCYRQTVQQRYRPGQRLRFGCLRLIASLFFRLVTFPLPGLIISLWLWLFFFLHSGLTDVPKELPQGDLIVFFCVIFP